MRLIITFLLLCVGLATFSQGSATKPLPYPKIILPEGFNVVLLFEYAINEAATNMSFDPKTEVQCRHSGNRLILSPLHSGIDDGSLYVELKTGHYYQFIVSIDTMIDQLTYSFTTGQSLAVNTYAKVKDQVDDPGLLSTDQVAIQKDIIRKNCLEVLDRPDNMGLGVRDGPNQIQFVLSALYYDDNRMYMKLTSKNLGNIPFEIKIIDFNKVNKSALKKKSIPIPLRPIYSMDDSQMVIEGNETVHKVYVFDKFTISNKKVLRIELLESKGERVVSINIPSRALLSASTF